MEQDDWLRLTIDRRSSPPGLTNEQFRAWMAGRRIFISSVMDDEMNLDRAAVRAWIESWGADPVMWETLVPRDERAVQAYLAGVDQSQIYVLLLGSRYGVGDTGGGSPTYRENIRAVELGLSRLVFKRSDVADRDRDPRLNDWLRSMYNELSIADYETAQQLTATLELRLREMASGQETPWIKVGSAVFPGKVQQFYGAGATRFSITAELADRSILEAIRPRDSWSQRSIADRLTFGDSTFPITDVEIEVTNQVLSRSEIQIQCRQDPQRRDAGRFGSGGMSFMDGTRRVGPAEQIAIWAGHALFGEEPPQRGSAGIFGMMAPTGPDLPSILARERARGWTAEGVTRIYIVEGLVKQFGGRFERLDVGPAVASGIPVAVVFQTNSFEETTGEFRGIVEFPV